MRKIKQSGYSRLWNWFGLSYSSWLTLPRSFMHEMPDEWQEKMAELLEEWDETWEVNDFPSPYVSARKGNRFVSWPDFVLNYRHPDKYKIAKYKSDNHTINSV